MKKDPLLRELTEVPYINYWIGPDSHAVCYLLRGTNLYNIVLLCPDTLPPNTTIAPATREELTQLFSTWDPRIQRLISLVSSTQKWRLQNSVEMPHWTHASGKFCLLGDACHATLPYLAQGAAMAVEDGAVLGGLLAGVCKADAANGSLGVLLREYERLRKSRTTRVVQGSSALRGVFHMRDGEEQRERDRKLLGPPEGSPMPWRNPDVQKWLFGYDAEKVVRDAWRRDGTLVRTFGVPGERGEAEMSRL